MFPQIHSTVVGVAQVTLAEGAILCGFGKTKFAECPADPTTIDHETQWIFEVTDNTWANVDQVTGPMQDVLDYAKSTKPNNCKVCYHKALQDPEGNWMLEKDNGFFSKKTIKCSMHIL